MSSHWEFGGDRKILTLKRHIHNNKFDIIMIQETMINGDKFNENMAPCICNWCFMAIDSFRKSRVQLQLGTLLSIFTCRQLHPDTYAWMCRLLN